ncbi:hypothetical protein C3B44_00075 [Corynebacterium yudongzhengii]|uniref:Uncharacterized protein n=1 Tax=Corynebacterium yudongzhengii TaxID=2080740 RepID=A0A2U1T558_9CORY|nr:hypothetical protein [Corynebacterium yudongzhengii]AWB80944.1 hypothetical protein C3B44_00075 [Corynebacterium yudongzhengii]PWC01130.1 hypothetical protein DF222_09170 [Corynebacterium yudongzhengii]
MDSQKIIVYALLAVGAVAAVASFFTITAGVLSVVVVLSVIVMAFLARGEGLGRLLWASAGVGLLGVILAGLGTFGLMGQVSSNCHHLDPRSEEGITCFNEHYSPGWGLYHVLAN